MPLLFITLQDASPPLVARPGFYVGDEMAEAPAAISSPT
jgi:hypothetical protein